jgi:hypothetical protein
VNILNSSTGGKNDVWIKNLTYKATLESLHKKASGFIENIGALISKSYDIKNADKFSSTVTFLKHLDDIRITLTDLEHLY